MPIRTAHVKDAAAIAKVHVDSWRTTYAHLLPADFLAGLSYSNRENFWRNVLSSSTRQGNIFVADEPGQGVVGFASGGPARDENTSYQGELYGIYLLSTVQRRGLGRQLVKAVAQNLSQAGHESMMVWVLSENPSRGFYEALGGEFAGEKQIEIADQSLLEVAYGWRDLRSLIGDPKGTAKYYE